MVTPSIVGPDQADAMLLIDAARNAILQIE